MTAELGERGLRAQWPNRPESVDDDDDDAVDYVLCVKVNNFAKIENDVLFSSPK